MVYVCSLYSLQGGNQTKEKRENVLCCVFWLQPLQQQGVLLKLLERRGAGSQDNKSQNDKYDEKTKQKDIEKNKIKNQSHVNIVIQQ